MLVRRIAVLAVATVLATASSASAAPAPRPIVTATEATRIAEEWLPTCDVIRAEPYRDGLAPMWFVETACADGTWKDLRIHGMSGEVVAVNGDYDV